MMLDSASSNSGLRPDDAGRPVIEPERCRYESGSRVIRRVASVWGRHSPDATEGEPCLLRIRWFEHPPAVHYGRPVRCDLGQRGEVDLLELGVRRADYHAVLSPDGVFDALVPDDAHDLVPPEHR